jgi:glycosyltransferase involved in cell wall biosynthesis
MNATLPTAAKLVAGAAPRDPQPKIAYILKAFPRTSETFITNEIYLLETLGLELAIFSVKRLENQKQHGNVLRIQAPITYLPEADPVNEGPFLTWLAETLPRFAKSHWLIFLKRPLAYSAALIMALKMCLRYRATASAMPKKVFFKEFLQAGYIASEVLKIKSIRHLHAHFCHGATTIAMLAGRICGLPFSFTAHAKDIYLKSLNPGDLLQRKLALASFAVTCTGANQHHLNEIRPKNARLHTIYHGLDISLFTPPARKSSSSIPMILSVGRFVEKKGFVYLVEACRLLADRGHRFECRIVGGRDAYFDVVQKRIDELELTDSVFLRPAVTQEELKDIYERATVFALPCLVVDNGDRDGIPNVLVEAMAMEIPVVSTDISGIPELVDSGVNGMLVSEKNPKELADAIATLLDNGDLRRRLGVEGRRKVRRLFDARENTAVLRKLFTECLAQPRVGA